MRLLFRAEFCDPLLQKRPARIPQGPDRPGHAFPMLHVMLYRGFFLCSVVFRLPNELFLKSIVPEILFVPISQGLPLRVAELPYDCGCSFVVLDVESDGPDPIIIGIHLRTSFWSLSKSRFLSAPPVGQFYLTIYRRLSYNQLGYYGAD